MTAYVDTPRDSRFGGLILPETTLAQMIRAEIGASYEATRPNNKNLMGWATSMGSADADVLPHRDQIAYQARDLDRNNPLAAGALDTIVDNVVSVGLRPQSRIDAEVLGLTPEQASAWQRQAERIFFTWADSKDSDVTRAQSFWEYQALALLNPLMSGDMFTIRRFKPRPGSILGTCLQAVEADRCATPPGREGPTSNVYSGVECDSDGEAARYHFLKDHPGSMIYARIANVGEYTSVPAVDGNGIPLCLHHYVRRRPDQKRGVSVFAPVIETFKQLGRYSEAELTAAVVSSMFAVFIKSQLPSGPLGGLAGTIPGQVGSMQVTPTGTGLTKLQSGMIADLAPGEDIAFANPMRANSQFESVVAAFYSQIGVCLGLPREVLMKHFAASYSASRAAILEAWKSFKRRRLWLTTSLCQPVWAWVISEAVARGMLKAPGFFEDPWKRAAWLGTTWRGAPMGQLDPLKEAKAAQEWLKIPGATTIQDIAAEQTGTDYEDNLEQTRREREQIAALPPDPLQPVAASPADPDDEDEGEQQ